MCWGKCLICTYQKTWRTVIQPWKGSELTKGWRWSVGTTNPEVPCLQKAKTLWMYFTKNWAQFHARSCLFCLCSSLNTRAPAGKARHLQGKRFGCLHTAGTTAAPGMCQRQEPAHTACLENTVNTSPHQQGHNQGGISAAQTTAKIWPEHQCQRVNIWQREKQHHVLKNTKSY